MQTLESTKTVYDLVTNASRDYGEKIFLEPYEYYDRDALITTSAEVLKRLLMARLMLIQLSYLEIYRLKVILEKNF